MNICDVKEHFKYYLENESQFMSTERFVYISKNCKKAYSYTYANLLMNICSDFESLIRAYYDRENDEQIEVDEIIELISCDEKLSKVFVEKAIFQACDYGEIEPLKFSINAKNNKKQFKWWEANNKIKHNKVAKMFHANQENVLNALASLYILNRYILAIKSEENNGIDAFSDDKKLFSLKNLQAKYIPMGDLFAKAIE